MGIISSGFYQVPNKVVGELNITMDKVYVPSMSSDIDINFGTLALSNEIPVASKDTLGGFKLAFDRDYTGSGTLDAIGKIYAVQLTSNETCSFTYVHVPWENSQYRADDDIYEGCLCAYSPESGINADGSMSNPNSITYFGIKWGSIHKDKLSTACFGDMVFADDYYSKYDNVASSITEPLSSEISTLGDSFRDALHQHELENEYSFNSVDLSINNLCTTVSVLYYDYTETSSKEEISAALTSLNSDVIKYYLNPDLNPAYLENQTSSKEELKTMFDTKQNNLNIIDDINKTLTYSEDDIPDVSAVCKYVKSELEFFDQTFHGSFSSWSAVPAICSDYPLGCPNKNDYIYVVTEAGDGSGAEEYGTCKFKMKYEEWQEDQGRNNWGYEIRINESPMTTLQLDAVNSGINSDLVAKINNNEARLGAIDPYINSFKGFSQQTWIFELQDGSTISNIILAR